MRIDRPARRGKPISLTPLVDVIFLLLLFFMLSSTFTSFGRIELGAPASGGGSGAVPEALITLDGTSIRLNGASVAADRIQAEAEKLSARDVTTVLLLARGTTTTQQLVQVLGALRAVPGLSVTVAR